MITGIDGDPDRLEVDAAAGHSSRVTTGRPLPDEPHDVQREPVNVLVISAEDNVGQVVRPRLRIAEADPGRVVFLMRPCDDLGRIVPLSIPEDLTDVQRIIVDHEIRLVVIDPSRRTGARACARTTTPRCAGYDAAQGRRRVDRRGDRHRASPEQVRRGQSDLPGRRLDRDHRGGASTLLTGSHPDNDGERVLARIKNNLAPPADAWVCRADAVEDPLNPGRTQPRITWLRTERLSADDVLRATTPDATHRRARCRDRPTAGARQRSDGRHRHQESDRRGQPQLAHRDARGRTTRHHEATHSAGGRLRRRGLGVGATHRV
jgi:AAA domain